MSSGYQEAQWAIEDFRAWLAAMRADAIAGWTDTNESCPLAQWRLRAHNEPVSVGGGLVVLMDTLKEFRLPDWAHDFSEAIDEAHADEGEEELEYRTEATTASECLAVLDAL